MSTDAMILKACLNEDAFTYKRKTKTKNGKVKEEKFIDIKALFNWYMGGDINAPVVRTVTEREK